MTAESDAKERIETKIEVSLMVTTLRALVQNEQWVIARDYAESLVLKLRQLELLDIQRKQENKTNE